MLLSRPEPPTDLPTILDLHPSTQATALKRPLLPAVLARGGAARKARAAKHKQQASQHGGQPRGPSTDHDEALGESRPEQSVQQPHPTATAESSSSPSANRTPHSSSQVGQPYLGWYVGGPWLGKKNVIYRFMMLSWLVASQPSHTHCLTRRGWRCVHMTPTPSFCSARPPDTPPRPTATIRRRTGYVRSHWSGVGHAVTASRSEVTWSEREVRVRLAMRVHGGAYYRVLRVVALTAPHRM